MKVYKSANTWNIRKHLPHRCCGLYCYLSHQSPLSTWSIFGLGFFNKGDNNFFIKSLFGHTLRFFWNATNANLTQYDAHYMQTRVVTHVSLWVRYYVKVALVYFTSNGIDVSFGAKFETISLSIWNVYYTGYYKVEIFIWFKLDWFTFPCYRTILLLF